MIIPPLPAPGCRICHKQMVDTLTDGIYLCPLCDRAPRPKGHPHA